MPRIRTRQAPPEQVEAAPDVLAVEDEAPVVEPEAPALDPLTQAAVDAASEPLPGLEEEVAELVAAAAEGTVTPVDAIAAIMSADPLSRLMAGHDRTIAAVERIAALEQSEERRTFAVRMAEESLAAIRDFARNPAPAPAAPTVNVTVPEQPVTVNVEAPTVNVPEQPAPVVNVAPAAVHVAPAEAPKVDVHVAAPEAPVVNVAVPEPARQEPPVVHVHAAAAPTARRMRIEENPVTGVRTVTVDDEDDG